MNKLRPASLIPVGMAAVGILAGVWWLGRGPGQRLTLRVPGADLSSEGGAGRLANPVLAGRLIPSGGRPANLPGAWPGFRGPDHDGINREPVALTKTWDATKPRALWSVAVGEGYAGAAVLNGRVYVMDYDRARQENALRCLSLADGAEIWRYAFPVRIKRNHGMSRTVPAVTAQFAVAVGPKCNALCVDADTGRLRWGLNLVRQFGARVPPWYTGQCPLIDGGVAILAPGGRKALLLAIDCTSGRVRWQTPNPRGWKMTHSSVMPMEFAGRRMYIYCASGGVVGVSAKDGTLLWQTDDWRISIATVPSPVVVEGGRIFLAGGYNAGGLMLQLKADGDALVPHVLFRLKPEVFGATQQTPICYDRHLFGVRPDGEFVCLDLDGRVQWTSGPANRFGLGSFLVADGAILAMNDAGRLSLLAAVPDRFHLLGQAQVLDGHESWAPLALAGGRLLVRDLTRLVCLEVRGR